MIRHPVDIEDIFLHEKAKLKGSKTYGHTVQIWSLLRQAAAAEIELEAWDRVRAWWRAASVFA